MHYLFINETCAEISKPLGESILYPQPASTVRTPFNIIFYLVTEECWLVTSARVPDGGYRTVIIQIKSFSSNIKNEWKRARVVKPIKPKFYRYASSSKKNRLLTFFSGFTDGFFFIFLLHNELIEIERRVNNSRWWWFLSFHSWSFPACAKTGLRCWMENRDAWQMPLWHAYGWLIPPSIGSCAFPKIYEWNQSKQSFGSETPFVSVTVVTSEF